jgi:hypothetical protein
VRRCVSHSPPLTAGVMQTLLRQLVDTVTSQTESVGKLTETLTAQLAATAARQAGGRKKATTSHIDGLQEKHRSRPPASPVVWDKYSTPTTKEYAEFEESIAPNMRKAMANGTVVFPAGSDTGKYLLWMYSPDKAPEQVKIDLLEDIMDKLGRGSAVQVWNRCCSRYQLVAVAYVHPPPTIQDRGVSQA